MKVYICGWDIAYEGFTIRAVYTSEQEARDWVDKETSTTCFVSDSVYYVWETGSECGTGFAQRPPWTECEQTLTLAES